jgi:dipeptidyl aminopeptidase/acylaminoacyl peptidase
MTPRSTDGASDTGDQPAVSEPSVDALSVSDGRVYWVEGRPFGDVLVSWYRGRRRDVLPAGISVASAVHEYGGGAYLVHHGELFFVRGDDQRIWWARSGALSPLTARPGDGEHRHADLSARPDGRLLVCVRERHHGGEVSNELVAVPVDPTATATAVIASGADFYSSPRISPDGTRLAWISWNAPLMPWDGTELWVADLGSDGRLGPATLVAGGPDEAVSQPRWGPDGLLYFLSDRTDWTNLYRHRDGRVEPVILADAELGPAAWEFGYASYEFLPQGRIATTLQRGPHTQLALHRGDTRRPKPVSLPYTSLKPYLAGDDKRLVVIGATVTQGPTVTLIDPDTAHRRELTQASLDKHSSGSPELIRFPTRDGAHAHAVLHHPTDQPAGPPALLVRAHPGPTANTQLRFDPWISFFTRYGFTVLDVDYRGSAGYGRRYRTALRGRWGELDVTDCVDAVDHLAKHTVLDSTSVAICGSSAGGYTALRAVATTDTFAAASVRHAVVDPATWARTAPKFQAHHPSLLVPPALGPPPAGRGWPPTAINAPLLMIHGERDTVTPIAEVRRLATALGNRASLLTFADEAHGLRHPGHVNQALRAELDHLRRHLGQ